MIQSPTIPISASTDGALSADDRMFAEAGDVAGVHAAVIGEGGLATLCGLIRRGASAATEIGLRDRIIPPQVELALVPRVETRETAAQAVALARRVLLPCGRAVVKSSVSTLRTEIVALFRGAGFAKVRVRASNGDMVISAELPHFAALSMGRPL